MSKKGSHAIPAHVDNSTVVYLVNERIRYEKDREILLDHWFRKKSFRALADDHQCSETYVKGVVYGFGDPLLLEAARLDAKNKI